MNEKMFKINNKDTLECATVLDGLFGLYQNYILELEKEYMYDAFMKPILTPGDFISKPLILLLGQYSTGKTTFIKHLIEKEYNGMRIGPEPTTDKFVTVMYGSKEQVIPGYALVSDMSKPFTQLEVFGNTFLSKLECALTNSEVLKNFTIIDTPGVLSGMKQMNRGYDFENVLKWFAQKADMIILMFDAHTLDITDEFGKCIQALKGQDSKIRIILNKVDSVTNQQLMRVYGSLMWSLGMVIQTPEVSRVYLGSFWDKELINEENRNILEKESIELYNDISKIPRNSTMNKLNEFVKRCRLLKAHMYLLSHLRNQMPVVFGKDGKKKNLLEELEKVYKQVSKQQNIPVGDFPCIETMREKLEAIDWTKIPKIDSKKIERINKVLNLHIPKLLEMIPKEQSIEMEETLETSSTSVVTGKGTPFLDFSSNDIPLWVKQKYLSHPVDVTKYEKDFNKLGPDANGKLSGGQVKEEFIKSKLPNAVLHKIWNLADLNEDGYLDLYEYSLARHFIEMKNDGVQLPSKVPQELYK